MLILLLRYIQGDNHGSDDHAPRGVPVASADEINTVSEEAGGVTADLGVAANANEEPSSSVIERPASTNPILDLNENVQKRHAVHSSTCRRQIHTIFSFQLMFTSTLYFFHLNSM